VRDYLKVIVRNLATTAAAAVVRLTAVAEYCTREEQVQQGRDLVADQYLATALVKLSLTQLLAVAAPAGLAPALYQHQVVQVDQVYHLIYQDLYSTMVEEEEALN
jgi:hypothetical protein